MDRRNFLQKLGIGAAACAVVPLINNTHENIMTNKKHTLEDDNIEHPITPKDVLRHWRKTGEVLTTDLARDKYIVVYNGEFNEFIPRVL